MAEAGAKVLNAQAVEFAKEKGIAIYARATQGRCPAPIRPRTARSSASPPRMPGTVVGVASERDLLVLDGSARRPTCSRCSTSVASPGKQLHVFDGPDDPGDLAREPARRGQLREALQTRLGGRARLVDGLAAVSAIGAGINATYANVLAGSATLAGIGIVPAGIATSSFRITWLVPNDRVNEAVRALHERYIEQQRPLVP